MNLPFIIVSSCLFVLWLADFLLGVHRAKHNNRIHRQWYDDTQVKIERLQESRARIGCSIENLQEAVTKLMNSSGGFWETAKGTVLQVRQMSDAHLENVRLHLIETDRADSRAMHEIRTEQKRRARDRRLSPTYQVEIGIERPGDILRRLAGETIAVEAKGVDKVEQRGPMTVNQAIAEAQDTMPLPGKIDWPEVDKLVMSLIERCGLSGLKHDLWKLRHLLGRGRAGK